MRTFKSVVSFYKFLLHLLTKFYQFFENSLLLKNLPNIIRLYICKSPTRNLLYELYVIQNFVTYTYVSFKKNDFMKIT